MRSKSVSVVAAALAAVVMLGTAGCASEANSGSSPSQDPGTGAHAELVKKAKAEGTVVWYTVDPPEVIDGVTAAFDKLYGIKVQAVRGPSAKAVQRYESERDANAPVVDVLEIGSNAPILANAKDFVDLASQPLESLATWPKDAFSEGNISISSGVDPIAIIYNTDLVSESKLPKTWPDLMKNNIGPIATPDMSKSDVWAMLLDFLDVTYGDEVLTDFAKAPRTVFDSSIPAMQSVASGELTFGIGAPTQTDALMKSGAPIKYFVPDATPLSVKSAAVPKNAPHLNAGLLFMDFIMSTEGQTIIAGTVSASVLKSVTGAIQLGSGAVPMNEERALKNRDRLVKLAGF